jgi:hypothetical protein
MKACRYRNSRMDKIAPQTEIFMHFPLFSYMYIYEVVIYSSQAKLQTKTCNSVQVDFVSH